MKGKDLLAAMHAPDDHAARKTMGIEALEELQDKLSNELERLPIDDAFMRAALENVFDGLKAAIDAGMPQTPALQFVFLGMRHKTTGKLAAEVMQQGMGLTDDKGCIVDAVKHGVEMVEGRIFVVLVDEAWMYEASGQTTDEITKKVESGEIQVSDVPEEKRIDALVLNGIGCGVQYFMACPIKREGDKRIVEKGKIICNRDKGTTLGGRMAVYGKQQ